MESGFVVPELPPKKNVESIAILKILNTTSRVLGELKGEVKKSPTLKYLLIL